MQPCQNCQTVIDEYTLDKQLEPLRELTVDDFNLCGDCVTIADGACVECGGAVYVPRNEDARPDFCPACRSDRIERTGRDPGWHLESPSTT
ncbi:hypothetical protein I7X12_14770 [Halosimplex litoreum]|uniref:Small CPxCG-related zinc finger protein n=1 Tax=Halosimplex litoreum TaxID=1198301 RepID=A0A7T3FWF5_9EURY|nr:hypothetical protein [Halosimplex litoreum]QPV62005.1 hypothetical protein I7X12_14770 [Halosimplex litoreum]